jgi:hypothetical protein
MKIETRKRYIETLPFLFVLTSPSGKEESYEGGSEGKTKAQDAKGREEAYREEGKKLGTDWTVRFTIGRLPLLHMATCEV